MRRIIVLTICTILLSAHSASPEVDTASMAASLREDLRHPYLYFSEEDKPAMLKRIEDNPVYGDIMKRLEAEGNRLLYTPVENWLDQIKNGSGSIASFARGYVASAKTLAFLYQMSGDTTYVAKAFEFADAVCALPSWTGGGSHSFPIIYHRVWPMNVPDDQVNFNYDIHTGDISRELATVYDWLYPALDRYRRDRIRGALLENAITRVRGNYEYHWWASAYRCNWCSVCNSGLGCAAAALILDDPNLVDVLAMSYNGVEGYLNSFGVDGGWQEGCSYWSYGFPQSVYVADVFKRITGGRYDLFKTGTLSERPVNFPVYTMFPNNKSVYFCDSYSRRPGNTYIINKLAQESGSGMAAWYRENFFGTGRDIFDIIWPESAVKATELEHTSFHFSGIDWVIMRSDFTDKNNVTVACKAGWLDDPHHGHLDCGTFVIQWLDQEFISEAGLRGYDEIYFSEARWKSPQASSVGHNVVFVNDERQIPAKLKNQPWKEGIGGRVLDFTTSGKRDYVLMDPSGAYPGEELKSWRRHIIHEKPEITIVLDEIGAERGDDIVLRFHSKCDIIPEPAYTLLEGKGGSMAIIPRTATSFSFRKGRHAFQRVREGTDFAWIPYVDLSLEAKTAQTIIATLILPVEDDDDAGVIASSCSLAGDTKGGYLLSFEAGGEPYKYRFLPDRSGQLVLDE